MEDVVVLLTLGSIMAVVDAAVVMVSAVDVEVDDPSVLLLILLCNDIILVVDKGCCCWTKLWNRRLISYNRDSVSW